MTWTEIKADIRSFLDEKKAKFWTDVELLRWANRGLSDFAVQTGQPRGQQTTNTVSGQRYYALPDSCLKLLRVTYDGDVLQPVTFRELDNYFGKTWATSIGAPDYYYVWNNQIGTYPLVNEAKELAIFFIASPDLMTDDDSIPDITTAFHKSLVYFALSEAFAKRLEPAPAEYWFKKYMGTVIEARAYYKTMEDDKVIVLQDPDNKADEITGWVKFPEHF